MARYAPLGSVEGRPVSNRDTRAAWNYHNGTKHPSGHLLDRSHVFNPMSPPTPFKVYAGVETLPLAPDMATLGVPALSAISTNRAVIDGDRTPDIDVLARILYFSAGITKRIGYPWGEMAFRAAACTGGLYHIELYVVCGELPGLEAGVYNFDPRGPGLQRLRKGDYRGVLADAAGEEHSLTHAPAVLVYTDVFWRNSCKYQAREYRHAFWDSGTIMANTLAICSAHEMTARVVTSFVDHEVNRLLDLDVKREAALALLPIGHVSEPGDRPVPAFGALSLDTLPISDYEVDFPPIQEMHRASSLASVDEARCEAVPAPIPAPSGRLLPLDPFTTVEMPHDPIETVIVRRGSTRRFSGDSISFRQLSTALHRSMVTVPADYGEGGATRLSDAYFIVNAVDGLVPGAYVFHPQAQALELLKEGDFRNEAGHLGLDQALAADASVDIFLLSELGPILGRHGNRGYRAAQLDASVTAGRLYLAAYAQQFGATGLTFYDDEVIDFFLPHAQGKSVMFLVALGKKLRKK